MEFPMKYDSQFEEMKSSRPDEHLRYYEVAKYSFEGEKKRGWKSNTGLELLEMSYSGGNWKFFGGGSIFCNGTAEAL